MLRWISKNFALSVIPVFSWISIFCYSVPQQVTIIRHAERYDTGPLEGQLNPTGLRRAGALASFLTLSDPGTTNVSILVNGAPNVLFAARPTNDKSNNTIRCIQTISTTATTLGSPIHSPFGFNQESELVNLIMNNPLYEGKRVLICWHHPRIKALVEAFGYIFPSGFDPYPATAFDLVWFLPLPAPSPAITVEPVYQELLYGDTTTP